MDIFGVDSYIFIFVAILGLCLGSFYNVVILRSLNNESIIFPPSRCPKCKNRLMPWHNIPILSYIFLRGKCAYCKEKISPQYPIVEFVTAILFVGILTKFEWSITTLFALFWISCLIIMTTMDLKEKVVECSFAIAIAVSGIIYSCIANGWIGLRDSIIGGLIGALVIEVIAWLGILLKKGRAMGEADTIIAGALGIVAGLNVGWLLIYSLIISMIFVLPVFWYDRYKANDCITLLFSAIFISSIALTQYFNSAIWTLVLLIASGLILSAVIVKNIKNRVELTTLPFVPSLALGFLYYLMFVL